MIVGASDDPHVRAVVAAARYPVEVLDASTWGKRPLTLTTSGLEVDARPLLAGNGWIRRIAPTTRGDRLGDGTMLGAQRAAGLSALAAVLHDDRIGWLTPIQAFGTAENKPVQYRRAEAVSVPVPTWLVTTDPRSVPVGGEWVAKPLGPGFFYEDSAARIVPTTALSTAEVEAVRGAPFLIQQRIEAEAHARIVTVRSRTFGAVLDASNQPLDWRLSKEAHTSFAPFEVPDQVCLWAAAAARANGVGYSAQDWILDKEGRWWFIDLNPAGQWLFLPGPVADAVTAAVAHHLEGEP